MTNSSSPKRGRPTLLDRRIINRLAHAAQSGKTRAEMAAHVGVSLSTLQAWISMGRKAREEALAAGGGQSAPAGAAGKAKSLEELALLLVVALENAARKRQAVEVILSEEELDRSVAGAVKPIGRPPVLSPALVDAVVGLCAAGEPEKAAVAAGVDRRTVQRWLTRGRAVHVSGGAVTEYERLCGSLFARVEAAGGSAVTQPGLPGGPASPSRLTRERAELLAAAVAGGANRIDAARAAGISYRTFARWLTVGAKANAAGAYRTDHEGQCGLLREMVTAADLSRAAGPGPVVEVAADPGVPRPRRLPDSQKDATVPPPAGPGPASTSVRPQGWALLGRLVAGRLGLRRLVRVL
ncbi:hypothetical protein ACFVHW_04240 [Streptomyces sp. NPDC127110]|uniref:hypothetical protein n=1 Tax=Streptomyces sp. NPDC127110 TaxID=3345362 RepID=UPI003638FA53